MAQIDESVAYGVETNNEDGHEVHYHFRIRGFIYTESLHFTRDHQTECWEVPTFWKVEVRFQRLPSSKSIMCHLRVKRVDDSPVEIRASSTVRFYNAEFLELGHVLSFPTMEVRSRQEVQRTANPVLSPLEMTSLLRQELKVQVSLYVTYCHRVRPRYDPIASLSASMDKMFFPD